MAISRHLGLCLSVAMLSGCVLWAREPGFYAEEIGALLETRTDAVEACYDAYLRNVDPAAEGQVVVGFEVRAKTGELVDVRTEHGDLPEPLVACVIDQMAGLKLDPPDQNTGEATFTWELSAGPPKDTPLDPFASVQDTVLGCYSTHLREVDREAQGDLVVDYAFDQDSGTIETLNVVAEKTTAPADVVACAKEALDSAQVDPAQLEERNVRGQRVFALRFVAWAEEG